MKPRVKAKQNKSIVDSIKQSVTNLFKKFTIKKKITKPKHPVDDHNWWEFV